MITEGQVTFPFWCLTQWVTEGQVTSPLLVPHPLDYGRTSYMATILLQTDRLIVATIILKTDRLTNGDNNNVTE